MIQPANLSRVNNIGLAPEPLKISSPLLRPYLLGGALLGLVAGMGLVLLGQNVKTVAQAD